MLLLFSVFVAAAIYPDGAWLLGASLGAVALLSVVIRVGWVIPCTIAGVYLVSVVIRVGWVIPCTIAGVYLGMFVLDPAIKGGDPESQMMETVSAICIGTVIGMAVGFVIEACHRQR